MRQGNFNLKIWKNQPRDLSFEFNTPGFPDKNSIAKDINILLNKLPTKTYERKEIKTHEAIKNKFHQLYLNSEDAFLEIKLPDFEYPVIFDEVIILYFKLIYKYLKYRLSTAKLLRYHIHLKSFLSKKKIYCVYNF